MKIRLFSAERGGDEIPDVLEQARRRDLASRNETLDGGGYIRLDDIRREGGVWLMNFIRSRESHGPTRVSRARKPEKIPYDKDQSPGEEAAALYDADTRHMLVQQTGHFRVTPIRDYLNAVRGGPFCELAPVPDADAYIKFEHANEITKINFGLETQGLSHAHFKGNIFLEKALEMALAVEGLHVEVTVSNKRRKTLRANALDAARKLFGMIPDREERDDGAEDSVSKLQVGVLNPDQKTETLNLVLPVKEVEIPMDLDSGRVFPLAKRYDALRATYGTWKQMLRHRRLD